MLTHHFCSFFFLHKATYQYLEKSVRDWLYYLLSEVSKSPQEVAEEQEIGNILQIQTVNDETFMKLISFCLIHT